MKAFITAMLLIFIIGNIGAVDIESYLFIDHIRAISVPGRPEIYEDGVIFTAPSSYQRVGISFAHEAYAKVHWFKRLVLPRDPAEIAEEGKDQKKTDPNRDSGVMFHFESIPRDAKNMDYRMIINGLWTADPLNPLTVTGPSGLVESRVTLTAAVGSPGIPGTPGGGTPAGTYRFCYQAPPGETITVGGSFNNWDPFMYELQELSPGFYTLVLPLPPGTFQYVFFHRGERSPDPANSRRLYSRDGKIVCEAVVE